MEMEQRDPVRGPPYPLVLARPFHRPAHTLRRPQPHSPQEGLGPTLGMAGIKHPQQRCQVVKEHNAYTPE
uniref:Uncharacterized protein n=1 Tax=Trichuris muris TaxID=70415 RepID=A0A5S6R542_TRIMR